MNDDLKDIEREIRAWTARPPARPPGAARTRVLARLGERRARPRWRLAVAGAVSALALVMAILLLGPEAPDAVRPTGVRPPGPTVAAAEPAAGLLVYQLRSGTKLYFALTSSRPADEPPAESTFQR